MMQVMLGALIQILPVVAGANLSHPLRLARVVHPLITLGALLLSLAFLTYEPLTFLLAGASLGIGVLIFIAAAVHALRCVPPRTPTIRGLQLALLGLGVTVSLGMLLAVSIGLHLPFPVMEIADVHLTWGFTAWGGVLLAAVSYVVVPMFQLTPAYPDWFCGRYSTAALGAVVLWSLSQLADWQILSSILGGVVVAVAALYLLITVKIQRKSKRARFDATQHYWRLAMLSALAACLLWLAASQVPVLAENAAWPLLFGVLLVLGGFMSVIVGMLYKIVPFLVWLHLQNLGKGRVMAPNMKKVLSEPQMRRQMMAHFFASTLVLCAVFQPEWFVYPAGIALILANAWLLRNLLAAAGVYRKHCSRIAELAAGQA
jgi:hypothetical protein